MNKYVVTPHSKDDVKYFNNKDIGGIVLGTKFGIRNCNIFSIEDIVEITKFCNKEIFILCNKLFHNKDILEVKDFLFKLDKLDVILIVSDLGILNLIIENNLDIKVLYSTETTITNSYFTEFVNTNNMIGLEVAKEITFKEVEEICSNKMCNVMYHIHGHIYMYYTKRKLLDNYFDYKDELYNNKEYSLFDEERELYYPIFQEEDGTHILAAKDMCLIDELNKVFTSNIDYLKIDGYGYNNLEYRELVNIYIKAKDLYNNDDYENNKELLRESIIKNSCHKNFDKGFFKKKTTY